MSQLKLFTYLQMQLKQVVCVRKKTTERKIQVKAEIRRIWEEIKKHFYTQKNLFTSNVKIFYGEIRKEKIDMEYSLYCGSWEVLKKYLEWWEDTIKNVDWIRRTKWSCENLQQRAWEDFLNSKHKNDI